MADDDSIGFAPPPFKAAEALVQLKRSLRDLRSLGERADTFEWKGMPVVQLSGTEHTIDAKLARKPLRSPDWESRALKSSADVRRWLDEVRLRLSRWNDDD